MYELKNTASCAVGSFSRMIFRSTLPRVVLYEMLAAEEEQRKIQIHTFDQFTGHPKTVIYISQVPLVLPHPHVSAAISETEGEVSSMPSASALD